MASETVVPAHPTRAHHWAARHPMATFIVLAYTLSTAWFLNYLVDLGAVNGFGVIGSVSPALAAMVVAAIVKPEPSRSTAGKRWQLFGVASLLTLAIMVAVRLWAATGLVILPGTDPSVPPYPNLLAVAVDLSAAAAVGLVISGVHSQRQGVRDLLRSLDPRRADVPWYWWAIALGAYPAFVALGNGLAAAVGLTAPAPNASGPWHWLTVSALIMFAFCLVGGGGLEEPGWRGLALPLLQKRFSPLRSSLILGVLWTFWHWPQLLLSGAQGGLPVVVSFFLQVVSLALLFTAVFHRARGSLLVVVVLHAAINATDLFLSASALTTIVQLLVALGVALWMWRSPGAFAGDVTPAP